MSRPLRIEFPGAVFHVTSRGDRREQIYRDDTGRGTQLAVLDEITLRFDAKVRAQQEDDADFWASHKRGQDFLGDEAFAERARQRAAPAHQASPQVPARHRKATPAGPRTWPAWLTLKGQP
jgi:hypothetical protein